jgi:hypothetical protein
MVNATPQRPLQDAAPKIVRRMRKATSRHDVTEVDSIYPLAHGQPYTIAALRAAETSLMAERQADQGLS